MARGRKTSIRIDFSDEQRNELESWQRSTTMRAGVVRRGRVILLLAAGMSISQIARTVQLGRRHIYKWAARFIEEGVDGLADKPGRGRKPSFPPGGRGLCSQTGLRAA